MVGNLQISHFLLFSIGISSSNRVGGYLYLQNITFVWSEEFSYLVGLVVLIALNPDCLKILFRLRVEICDKSGRGGIAL